MSGCNCDAGAHTTTQQAFGDLAWVPFTYSLQARYLVDHSPGLSTAGNKLVVCTGNKAGTRIDKTGISTESLPHMHVCMHTTLAHPVQSIRYTTLPCVWFITALVGVCLLKAVGYWIFRGSNGEKDAFRCVCARCNNNGA
jgi:hypothetical protein